MAAPQPLIAGNWKMNGLGASVAEAEEVARSLDGVSARVAICPPAVLIHRMSQALEGTPLLIGGQDNHWDDHGAFTGDTSAEMLADAGADLVILGHSERRAGYRETDEVVARKVEAALRAGLEPIVCVGETLAQREAGKTLDVVVGQVRGSLPESLAGKPCSVAYEPVWAIGSGLTPTTAQIEEVHRAIRDSLEKAFGPHGRAIPILYGGSLKPGNAAEILSADEVGGALVGGASLKAQDFLGIIRAVPATVP
jgi:triosephosphate isomerase